MKKINSLSIGIGFILMVILIPLSAEAEERAIEGYAWSSTVGWVSFSNETDGSAFDYGVTANIEGAGNPCNDKYGNSGARCFPLSGQAWSDNVGWIDFDISSFGLPSDNGALPRSARLNNNKTETPDDDFIEGFARVCSALADKVNCSGTALDQNAGGWTGLISFYGKDATNNDIYDAVVNDNEGLDLDDVDVGDEESQVKSRSWGDAVLGWLGLKINIDSPVDSYECSDTLENDDDGLIDELDPGCHSDEDVNNPLSYVPTDDDESNGPISTFPSVTFGIASASGNNYLSNITLASSTNSQDVRLRWEVSNVATCSAGGEWSGVKATTSSPYIETESVVPDRRREFTLSCTSPSGESVTKRVTVTVTSVIER